MLSKGLAIICRNQRQVSFVVVHTCLRHHPSPSDDICSTFGTSALLKINNRPQKTIQVIIDSIVQLLESLEAF